MASLTIRNALGVLLVVAGLVAVPIPIIPGLPMIAAGSALLGRGHPLVRWFWNWWGTRDAKPSSGG